MKRQCPFGCIQVATEALFCCPYHWRQLTSDQRARLRDARDGWLLLRGGKPGEAVALEWYREIQRQVVQEQSQGVLAGDAL